MVRIVISEGKLVRVDWLEKMVRVNWLDVKWLDVKWLDVKWLDVKWLGLLLVRENGEGKLVRCKMIRINVRGNLTPFLTLTLTLTP